MLSTVKAHGVKPFRKARVFLVFDQGFSDDRTLLEWARDRGIVGDSDQISLARMEYIAMVAERALWEPSEIPKVMAQLELEGVKPPEAGAKPAAKKTAKKKAAKKKATKKKSAKKVSAKA